MFGLGFWEIVIIAVLALLLIGPDNLPDTARKAGKLMRDLRRATDDIRDQVETEIYADELQRRPPAAPVPTASSPPAPERPPGELPPSFIGIQPADAAPPAGEPTPALQPAPAPAPPEEPRTPTA